MVGDVKIGPIVLTAVAAVILVIGLLGLGALSLSQGFGAIGIDASSIAALGWGLIFLAVVIAILYVLVRLRD